MAQVLLVDDDRDFCEGLSQFIELINGSEGCIAVHSLDEMVRRREEVLGCDLAILDVNLGPAVPSGVDVLEWLRKQGFKGRTAFLTAHAAGHPLVQRARESGSRVFEKPVDSDALEALIREAT